MSAKRELDSSLELLLDTMCNTFGAVVFIAISLSILVSMTSKIESAMPKENTTKMKQELAEVTALLKELEKETDDSAKLAEKLKNDPRRALITQKVLLEQAKKKKELEVSLQRTQANIIQANLKSAEADLQTAQMELLATTDNLKKNQEKLEEQEQKIMLLTENLRKVAPYKMAFITIRKSNAPPYFLIVKRNRIFQIGPTNLGNPTETDDDVDAVVSSDCVSCTVPDSVKGMPMLDAFGALSPEFLALLSKISKEKRVPYFSIHGDSLETFCKFRQLLKQRDVFHGVGTQFNKTNDFKYQINSPQDVTYEY